MTAAAASEPIHESKPQACVLEVDVAAEAVLVGVCLDPGVVDAHGEVAHVGGKAWQPGRAWLYDSLAMAAKGSAAAEQDCVQRERKR